MYCVVFVDNYFIKTNGLNKISNNPIGIEYKYGWRSGDTWNCWQNQ